MTFLSSLVKDHFYFALPARPEGWIALAFYLAVILYLGYRLWKKENRQIEKPEKVILLTLLILVPFSSLFLGFRISGGTPQGELVNRVQPLRTILMFSMVPWVLGGGIVHPVGAIILAGAGGFLTGGFETHSLFTLFEFSFLASIYCWMIRQHYRTRIYRLLRHPAFAAVATGLCYLPFFLLDTALSSQGDLAARLNVAISGMGITALAVLGRLLISGLIAEILYSYFPFYWVESGLLQPSPSEKNIEVRFFYRTGPIFLLLVIGMMVGSWLVAENAANQVLIRQLNASTRSAVSLIPAFIDSGQTALDQVISSSDLAHLDEGGLQNALSQGISQAGFYQQLLFVSPDGGLLAAFPDVAEKTSALSAEENAAIVRALKGEKNLVVRVSPFGNHTNAFLAFLKQVKVADGNSAGVIIGRTDFLSNPEAKSIIDALVNSRGETGVSYLVDANGGVIFQSGGESALLQFPLKLPTKTGVISDTNPDGSPLKVYVHPVNSPDWRIVVNMPGTEAQAMTWQIASPLFLMVFLLAAAGYASIRLGFRSITTNLRNLTEAADQIAQGQLEHRLPYQGIDEIGQLNQAFDQLRQTLRSQWDELETLLAVSQSVSSSLSLEDTVKPILQALVNSGASAARIVLTPDAMLDPLHEIPSHFGDGYARDFYAYLDDQILALCRTRDSLNLGNLIRGRVLKLSADLPHPGSIYAVPLRQNTRYNGVLWVAYDLPRVFSEQEIRYISTLAGEAALAVTNSQLYAAAGLVRSRMDAILAATPDPILVIDQTGRLLIANLPALELLGSDELFVLGQSVDEIVHQRELLDFLESDETSREIVLPGDRVFLVTAADMVSDHQKAGKVCILRDITRFKELETLKTEFVETVSHDLRGPLTLMRGYATMLQMVGDLNNQQKSYVKKMISGVEGMSRLVNNLLDLGRIESGEGLQIENVKVRELIERVISSLQLQATQKSIKLVADLPDDFQPVVQADQALLHQALYNLVENGIKFTPVHGQVVIQVSTEPGSLIFEVEDTGMGIAPLDQPRLFEKFYRPGVREGYHQRGSSLGLAIVKSIADRHNGKVWVESQLGKGSRFFLSIPYQEPPSPQPIEQESFIPDGQDSQGESSSQEKPLDQEDETEYNSTLK